MRFIKALFLSLAILPVALMQAGGCFAQSNGYTLNEELLYRINFGSAEDVRVLLGKGADPNARSKQGEYAINVAIDRGDEEATAIAIALVDKGADLTLLDRNGNTPLINALRFKQEKVVSEMLAKGADYHSRAPDGSTLVEYAKRNADENSAEEIQAMLDKEVAAQQSERTPDHFYAIAKDHTLDSCLYQYWSYFLSSLQAPERDADVSKKIQDLKSALYQQITQVQKFYTAGSLMAMHNVANEAASKIFNELDGMVSNSNRAENGIGKEEDAQTRCSKIRDKLPLNFVPVPLDVSTVPEQEPVQPAAAPPAPSPYPSSKR